MPTFPSKLRSDLVISRQETAGVVYYVLKDPLNGRFFRFKEAEYFIAERLDGTRSTEEIRASVEQRFQATVEPETVEGFLAQLREHGLLDTGQPPAPAERPVWNAKNPYSVRLRVFDPDALLDRWIGALWFLFTPPFAGLALLAIAWGTVTTVLNWGEIGRDFANLGLFRAVLLGWPVILLVGVAHEFAHGLTCKHFGGEVRDMGFLLIYYHPALYCNVSDAWLFPEKWKRLAVMFAGTFMELLLWALATLCWRLTDTGTLVNGVALVVMATSGVKTLLNFNPLLKLDGYYILSDVLDVPNLRKKSFLYIREKLGLAAPSPEAEPPSPREARVFLVYGVIASLFTISLLVFVVAKVGGFLMGRYQAWGFALFLLVLPVIFRYRLRRLWPGSSSPLPSMNALRAFPAKPRAVLLGAAGGLVILLAGGTDLKVTGDFTVLPVHNADVRAQVDGIVSDVTVNEGDFVRGGDCIAHLSPREYRSELEKCAADLEEATARLLLLRAGRRPEEIELARKELQTAQTRRDHAATDLEVKSRVRVERLTEARSAVTLAAERLRYAKSNLERAQKLADSLVISPKEFETVAELAVIRQREWESAVADLNALTDDDLTSDRRELAVAEGEASESEQKLRMLRAGSRREEIEATAAQVTRLEAQKHYLEEQLRLTAVPSPIHGIVTTPERQIKELPGQFVHKGDLIAEIYDIRSVSAEIGVSEKEIEDVHVGQRVALKARAYPSRVFTGKVMAIATTAHPTVPNNSSPSTTRARDLNSGARTILVTTHIPNPDLLLKPDMTGRAKIVCGRRSLLDLLTRRLARAIRVEFWSWW